MRPNYFLFLVCLWLLAIVACEPITPTVPPPTNTPIPTVVVVATSTPTNTPLPVLFPASSPTTTPMPGTPTTVQRNAPIPPAVQLVAPSQNAQISINQPVNIVVFAFAENNLARIDVTDDGIPLQVDKPVRSGSVYAAMVNWVPNTIGAHTLRVVAYDTQNRASAPDEVTVTVIQDARKPTSIIVYPIGIPQIDFGSVLPIYGVATDETGVTQVDLWVDNQLYTYLTATNVTGQPAFPFVFNWTALPSGQHTFLVRAHDNQDQTTDSAPLKVLVIDNQIPSLSVTFDRTSAPANEPIVITASAADISGIQKIEFLSGKEIFSTFTNPSRQPFASTQVVWQNLNPGEYSIVVRAQNANGVVKESTPQMVTILRAGQSMPATPTPTRTRTPRATTTPRPQPPAAPKAEIASPIDQFNSASSLRVTFSGQASSELERIELWGYYPGQTTPQVICTVDARATTQKTGQCDWTPPMPGIVTIYAQAIDIYRQVGRSAMITGFVGIPSQPTVTSTPATITTRWSAVTSTGPMSATFRQVGNTLRGEFKMSGVEATGRITNSTTRADRLTFSVDFTPEGATPAASALTIDFDCMTDQNAGTLSCTYRDSRGRTGAALFRRETTP